MRQVLERQSALLADGFSLPENVRRGYRNVATVHHFLRRSGFDAVCKAADEENVIAVSPQ